MNKFLFTIFILSSLVYQLNAQQQPFYTQYILNHFILNPALAGIENYWDVKLSYRNQWQGITGGPRTSYLTIQGPLKKIQYSKVTVSTIPPPRIKKSAAANYWVQYKSIIPHAGMGFSFLNDKIGPMNWYSVNVAYAYHVGLSPKISLSAGLTGGVQGVELNTDQLDFGGTNPIDPAVAANGIVREIKPSVGFGFWLYSAFYFVGASIQNIIPLKINYSTNAEETVLLVPHTIVSAGYKFFLNDKLNFLPSTVIRIVNNAPISFDVNTRVQYLDITWIGVSYRHARSFAAMLGVNVSSTINFGYSYDIASSNISYSTRGTHEIVIGILLGNRNRVLCPRDFW